MPRELLVSASLPKNFAAAYCMSPASALLRPPVASNRGVTWAETSVHRSMTNINAKAMCMVTVDKKPMIDSQDSNSIARQMNYHSSIWKNESTMQLRQEKRSFLDAQLRQVDESCLV